MREKIARFMQGRYGVDELARFLTGLSMVWIVLELITRNRFFEILFWVTVVWLYYRILSRDYGKRQQENSKFLTLRYRFTSKWNQWIHRLMSALSVAIYGMFVAVVVPEMKKARSVLIVVIIAIILSCLFYYIPLLSKISSGITITIVAITAAIIGSIFFPVSDEADNSNN